MDGRPGVFIVIEGPVGSGNTTQAKLVKERLEAAGHQVETFDFPQYNQPSSYFVRRYIEGGYGQPGHVGPYTSSLFYALDRFEAAYQIREALQAGRIVISNRFTGSSMAHQGTKMANAEERRGFFIWLDNLEFEMLRIPRPTISFVLRVPAEAAADQPVSTADVYDDMVQLFPKDFQRIDCVRSGRLLDGGTVNNMLWEKIAPLLPEPRPATPGPEPTVRPAAASQPPAQTQPAGKALEKLVIKDASGLLTQRAERLLANARLTYPDVPSIYTPPNLVPAAKNEYQSQANTLLGLYAKLLAGLAKRGVSPAEAKQAAGLALPLAATASVHLDSDDPGLEDLILSLLNDPMPELQAAGAQLLVQAIQTGNQKFKESDKTIKLKTPAVAKNLAEEFLTENHIGDPVPVQLTAVWPRNELDLVADILYEHTGLPLNTIRERTDRWPMSRKLAVVEAFAAGNQRGSILNKVHYQWDLFGPYAAFRELQSRATEHIAIQPLTPRYGYAIPPLIEEADLGDLFEKCGDLSLKLYSTLQQAGHLEEAQYAALHAHNQRWQLSLNASQLLRLLKDEPNKPFSRELLAAMRQKLAETHPLLGELGG